MSDIVLKDKNGVDNTYSGVNSVMLRNANGEYDKYVTEPPYITVASVEELNNTIAPDGTIAIVG